MILKIKKLIFDLCKGHEDVWENHILKVVAYSKELAKKLGADQQIVEIAAYLHDIEKLKGKKENHHIFGAEEAGKILNKFGFSEDKIKQVQQCILTHSSDKNCPPKTLEAKIVASADALSHFDNFSGMAYVAYGCKGLSMQEGRKWLIAKYKTAWSKLMPEAKKIAKKKHAAVKLLLAD